jgi:chemotaxis protein histidine kinase CheA
MQNAQSIAQKIDELRPRFLELMAQRLDRFEEIRGQLETAKDPTPLLEEIRFGAHRMVGLAATLGFGDLGDLAQAAELAIMRRPSRAAPDAQLLTAIDVLMGEMALLLAA